MVNVFIQTRPAIVGTPSCSAIKQPYSLSCFYLATKKHAWASTQQQIPPALCSKAPSYSQDNGLTVFMPQRRPPELTLSPPSNKGDYAIRLDEPYKREKHVRRGRAGRLQRNAETASTALTVMTVITVTTVSFLGRNRGARAPNSVYSSDYYE